MRVVLFGASGMLGQAMLRACFADPEIERVVSIVRSPTGAQHEKLVELVHADFTDFAALAPQLGDLDACFFCLGVSSAGMSEADYRRITYDYTLAAAELLAKTSPQLTFIYISGAGTDSTEQGRSMWARVKGQTENALLRLPFARAIMFRPAFIQPRHGIKSRTRWTRVLYVVAWPLYPLLRVVARPWVTNTDELSAAMLHAAKHGAGASTIVESRDLRALTAAT